MKEFMEKHWLALLCVFMVTLMILPFLWPFALAVVYSAAVVVAPVAAAALLLNLYDHRKKDKRFHKKKDTAVSRKRPEDVRMNEEKPAVPKDVAEWYEVYGREKVRSLVRQLRKEGIHEVWIQQDGICSVSTAKGFRRRGTLADFPGRHADYVARKIRTEKIASARVKGKYILLTFPEKWRAA